jgi:hypothetical protein
VQKNSHCSEHCIRRGVEQCVNLGFSVSRWSGRLVENGHVFVFSILNVRDLCWRSVSARDSSVIVFSI